MKYTIEGFNQKKAIEYDLDIEDLIILRWFVDFSPKMSEKNIDGKNYFWVDYKTILEDLPILNFKSKDRLYRKMLKMVEKGILVHKGIKNKDGSFSYYGFGNNYQSLISENNTPSVKNNEPVR